MLELGQFPHPRLNRPAGDRGSGGVRDSCRSRGPAPLVGCLRSKSQTLRQQPLSWPSVVDLPLPLGTHAPANRLPCPRCGQNLWLASNQQTWQRWQRVHDYRYVITLHSFCVCRRRRHPPLLTLRIQLPCWELPCEDHVTSNWERPPTNTTEKPRPEAHSWETGCCWPPCEPGADLSPVEPQGRTQPWQPLDCKVTAKPWPDSQPAETMGWHMCLVLNLNIIRSDFLAVYAQEWDCWVIWQVYFQLFKESPHCSP